MVEKSDTKNQRGSLILCSSYLNKILFLLLVFSLNAVSIIERKSYASSFLECQLEAKVLEVLDTKAKGGTLAKISIGKKSNGNCKFLTSKKEVLIEAKRGERLPDISIGMSLKIDYSLYSAMTENGAIQGETWSFIAILN